MTERRWVESGVVYLVATPIGNLSDWSPRAEAVLKEVDVILAEDTRVTGLLCHEFGIDTPLLSFHRHNAHERLPGVLDRLRAGDAVALVSDRGMPAISDPGRELAEAAWDQECKVSVVPGPSAVTAIYAVSGFEEPFAFWGFLPRRGTDRRRRLDEMAAWPYGSVLYEAPHHMDGTLKDLIRHLGPDRIVCVGREMTKRFEEFWRGPLAELTPRGGGWRGEIALVVGPPEQAKPGIQSASWETLISRVSKLVEEGCPPGDALRQVAKDSGVPRRELYQRVHHLKDT